MRKQIIEQAFPEKEFHTGDWINTQELAQVELSSEAPGHPIEAALSLRSGSGWRAALPGPQVIRLRFESPVTLSGIYLLNRVPNSFAVILHPTHCMFYMESPDGSTSPPQDKLTQMEAENQVLRQENRQLRADYATALFKLGAQIAVEKRYEESQSRFQTIFYQSRMGNKIVAPDLRILQINEVFRQMLGYPEKEIIGTRIIAFAHPDFVHHWHKLQENLWTRQIPSFQIETCLVRRDGSALWCQVTSFIFRDNGHSLGYTTLEDISRRKALEVACSQALFSGRSTSF